MQKNIREFVKVGGAILGVWIAWKMAELGVDWSYALVELTKSKILIILLFIVWTAICLIYLIVICVVAFCFSKCLTLLFDYYFSFEIVRVQRTDDKLEITIRRSEEILKYKAELIIDPEHYVSLNESSLIYLLKTLFKTKSDVEKKFYKYLKSRNDNEQFEIKSGDFKILFLRKDVIESRWGNGLY